MPAVFRRLTIITVHKIEHSPFKAGDPAGAGDPVGRLSGETLSSGDHLLTLSGPHCEVGESEEGLPFLPFDRDGLPCTREAKGKVAFSGPCFIVQAGDAFFRGNLCVD